MADTFNRLEEIGGLQDKIEGLFDDLRNRLPDLSEEDIKDIIWTSLDELMATNPLDDDGEEY